MKKYLLPAGIVAIIALAAVAVRPASALPVAPTDIYGKYLNDGDLVSANQSAGDPDIFIIKLKPHTNAYGWANNDPGDFNGFKRLFLNPAIFNMYGHLGGFSHVRQVTAAVRDSFVTSGLFRNCETNDRRVWGTEITGEDNGILHHVQISGEQAAAEDVHFFDKVFCINSREDNFYPKSVTPYYRIADIPQYFRRACIVRPACLDSNPRCLPPEPVEGWCPRPYPTPVCGREGDFAGISPDNPCCSGLEPVPFMGSFGGGSYCARPGCYYQQVQCVTTPCNPVLVCPTQSPPPFGRAPAINSVTATWPTNGANVATITISGTKPTPCDTVALSATGNDSAGRIDVTATVPPSYYACAQVITEFTQAVTVATNPSPGNYDIYVNGVYRTRLSY